MTSQILALYVQGALDSRDPTIGRRAANAESSRVSIGGQTVLDPSRNAPVRQLLAGQWQLSSPWMRTALRTATALAITVLAVQLTGAQFGFWVSLGALVALKLDASGTQRTASMVLVGTVVGFVIASVLVLAVGKTSGSTGCCCRSWRSWPPTPPERCRSRSAKDPSRCSF